MGDNSVAETIPSLLKYWSQVESEKPAFKFIGEKEDIIFSRREIYTKAGKLASILKCIGACKGDVVAMVMKDGVNCPDRLICELGIQMAGCVSVSAFGKLKNRADSFSILTDSNAKILITDESSLLTEDKFSTLRSSQYGIDIDCPDLPSLEHIMFTPTRAGESLEDQLNKENDIHMEQVSPGDRAVIYTTSGTTGMPKLVPHTHAHVLSATKQILQYVPTEDFLCLYDDRCLSWQLGFPSYFLCSGLTRVLRNQIDDFAPSTWDVIQKEKCSIAILSAEEVCAINSQCTRRHLSEPFLHTFVMSGQPFDNVFISKAKSISRFVVNLYGLTECGPISSLHINESRQYKDFCAGYSFPDTELMIVDEKGQSLQSGQKGEIYFKGPNVTTGYLTTNGISRRAFTSDGWFKTGDVGFIEPTGMLVAEGRGSDVIMRGDDLIYPLPMEKLMRGCPSIEDAVVVGVPDPVMHQEMCVCVQGADGFDDPISDLKDYLSDTYLPCDNKDYDISPKYYLLCDTFPKNRNGKTDRKQIIATAKVAFGLK